MTIMMKKIKTQSGESIAEVLIALLISSLALVMLASMISSTLRLVKTSENKMDAYYAANEALERISGSNRVTIEIKSEDVDGKVEVDVVPRPKVLFAVNEELGTKVYAYGTS